MSRIDQPLSEIPAGTHLVIVLEASLLKDNENLPVVAKDGSNGIKIRFNDNKLNHDKVFWTKSSDFKKLCKATGSDMTKPILPQLRGKELWMCVKEVKTMRDTECVRSEFVPFDYIECPNPEQKPIISGDPCQHPKGFPLGVFVEYVEGEITRTETDTTTTITLNVGPPKTKAEKIAIAKLIIESGEGKQMTSLNEKNDKKISDEAESYGESNDNNHVETDPDWDDL